MGRKTNKEKDPILSSTVYGVNPNIPHIDDRPRCSHDDCDKEVMIINTRKDGSPIYRDVCNKHHSKRTAAKHGLDNIAQVVAKNAGFKTVSAYLNHQARQEGYKNHTDKLNAQAIAEGYEGLYDKLNQAAIAEGYESYTDKLNAQAIAEGYKSLTHKKNMKHPYLRYRKEYCENIDGRLGFVCTTTIVWDGMLDVDHIDGNSRHNKEENLQTLCKCCHAYKTNMNKDYKTIGRTKLKELDKQETGMFTSLIDNDMELLTVS